MPTVPQQKRHPGKGRLTLISALCVLVFPTLVVLAVFHSLPELGEFKTRRAGGGGTAHKNNAARRSLPSKQTVDRQDGAAATRRTLIHNQKEALVLSAGKQGLQLNGAIMRGSDEEGSRRSGEDGADDEGSRRFGAGKDADIEDGDNEASGRSGIRHAKAHDDWSHKQQQEDGKQQEQGEQQQQKQQQRGSGLEGEELQAGQKPSVQTNGARPQAKQADANVRHAGLQKAGQQPARPQKAKPKPLTQAQKQERVIEAEAGLPQPLNGNWPNLLPRGSGKSLVRPNCADRQTVAKCKQWSADDGCKRNVGFMFANCPASCGLCTLKYLHGSEVPQLAQLAPGVNMPMVGYGTAGLTDITADAVFTAIRVGYRLVDSAGAREWYREDLVGWGWSASGIKREHLFITSKIHPRHLGYWSTLEVFNEALQDLQTDYVDLLLLHYPECWGGLCGDAKPEGTWQDSWAALEQLVTEKKLKAIGVSNFNLDQMAELVRIARVKPAVLQSNSDLLHQDWELQAFCRMHGIQFQAYSSLGGQWLVATQGQNPVLEHPVVYDIAVRLGRTTAQVALRWALQHGQAVLPRTTKVNRMEANLDLFSFDLTDADMQRLDALDGSLQLQEE